MTTLETPPYTPVALGPTWRRDADNRFVLPELTLGWQILGWTADMLQHSTGQPWRYTDEQARLTLWWYAIDHNGRFIYRDGVIQRLKGWGRPAKTPWLRPGPVSSSSAPADSATSTTTGNPSRNRIRRRGSRSPRSVSRRHVTLSRYIPKF